MLEGVASERSGPNYGRAPQCLPDLHRTVRAAYRRRGGPDHANPGRRQSPGVAWLHLPQGPFTGRLPPRPASADTSSPSRQGRFVAGGARRSRCRRHRRLGAPRGRRHRCVQFHGSGVRERRSTGTAPPLWRPRRPAAVQRVDVRLWTPAACRGDGWRGGVGA